MKTRHIAIRSGNKYYYAKCDECSSSHCERQQFRIGPIKGNRFLHRTRDRPAVINCDGSLEWWYNGEKHRENGPAVIYLNGRLEWWTNGELNGVTWTSPEFLSAVGEKCDGLSISSVTRDSSNKGCCPNFIISYNNQ